MNKVGKNGAFFVLVIFLGATLGNLLGDILGSNIKALEALKATYTIGMTTPMYLNMKIVGITFGVNFNLNIMSIIGMILAIILYRKY